jgi:hypothetical protein
MESPELDKIAEKVRAAAESCGAMILETSSNEGHQSDLCTSSSNGGGTHSHAYLDATADGDFDKAERQEIADRVQQHFES